MSLIKSLLISLPILGAAVALHAQSSTNVPIVRTVDLSAIVAGARPAVEIKSTASPRAQPAASVMAENIDWKGAEGAEMARIAALAPVEIRSNKDTDLRTVLRAICEAAQMKHYIQSDDPVMDSPVIMSGTCHPWEFLTNLATVYRLDVKYRNGLWNIYAVNTNELIAKTYVIHHNTLERFKSSGSGSGQASTQSSQKDNQQSSQGASGGGMNAPSVDRSSQSVFELDSKPLTDEVKKILTAQVDSNVLAGSDSMPGARLPSKLQGDKSVAIAPTVSFSSDSNTLYVIATREQHRVLSDWLAQIDQPLKLIYVETKFLLSTFNPTDRKGMTNPLMSGMSVGLSGLSNSVTPSHPLGWSFPSAILSASDMNVSLQMLATNSETQTVQYPQQTTIAGREVVLRSVEQIPISSSSTNDTTSGGSRTSDQLQYIDVGTVVSIIPKVLNERNILLKISITVSSIAGTEQINNNSTPKIRNQTYTNEVIVESGYSLALGGLEQSLSTLSSNKTPFLGDIPFFGFLFKDVTKSRARSVLTMIVTPTILDGYSGGNSSGQAQHTLPERGTPARSVFNPRTMQTAENVQACLRGFSTDIEELETILNEGRALPKHRQKALILLNELDLMSVTLDHEAANGRIAPMLRADIEQYQKRLHKVVSEAPRK